MTYYIITAPGTDMSTAEGFTTLAEARKTFVEDEYDITGGILAADIGADPPGQFKVEMYAWIERHGTDNLWGVFQKNITLPFVPTPQVGLFHSDVDCVCWTGECFIVRLVDKKVYSFEEHKEYLLSNGWELKE